MCRFIFIACLLVQHAKATTTTPPPICALENEEYYDNRMSPICDRNCHALSPNCPITRRFAVAGCYCRLGFARNLQQQCIPMQQCAFDCFPNEAPIAPMKRACEFQCRNVPVARTQTQTAPTQLCFNAEERKCICKAGYCRNRRAQCVEAN